MKVTSGEVEQQPAAGGHPGLAHPEQVGVAAQLSQQRQRAKPLPAGKRTVNTSCGGVVSEHSRERRAVAQAQPSGEPDLCLVAA
jgi:hypothetical protein